MKNILILGAGQSTPYLINYLLSAANQRDWFVTVGDYDLRSAQSRVKDHPSGTAIAFDVNDNDLRASQVGKADIVVNMLPPTYQWVVANDCVNGGTHMVSASYENRRTRALDANANRRGVLILNECGLDPGIDHMSAMATIEELRANGGTITSLKTYGGGLPAPDSAHPPLRYAITWNPRNVVMAGEAGATYLVDGQVKMIPHHEVFQRTWSVEVPGIGAMEAYPNRDSLYYQTLFDLPDAHTMIRGTLRYPGWAETWLQVVRLGMTNENMRLPRQQMKLREITEMFLPRHLSGDVLESRVASYLGINPTGHIMDNLAWLGLFSDDLAPKKAESVTHVLTDLLQHRLPLASDERDMVVLLNEADVRYTDNRRERVRSTLVEYGERGGFTAMSRTVGLPAALAVELILGDELPLTGCQLPTHAAIRSRILDSLRANDIAFTTETIPLD